MSIAIDDLPQQRHLAHALSDETVHFFHNLMHRTAAFNAATEGDNTERAGMAAAVDHRHVRADRPHAARCQMPDRLAGVEWSLSVLHCVAPSQLLYFKARGLSAISSFCRWVINGAGSLGGMKTSTCGKRSRSCGLGLTPTMQPIRASVLFARPLFHGLRLPALPMPLFSRALTYDAGVQHDDVGLVQLVGRVIADTLQLRGT